MFFYYYWYKYVILFWRCSATEDKTCVVASIIRNITDQYINWTRKYISKIITNNRKTDLFIFLSSNNIIIIRVIWFLFENFTFPPSVFQFSIYQPISKRVALVADYSVICVVLPISSNHRKILRAKRFLKVILNVAINMSQIVGTLVYIYMCFYSKLFVKCSFYESLSI